MEYYDEVALKGLILAQRDVGDGLLDAEAQERIVHTMTEVIEDLDEDPEHGAPEPSALPPEAFAPGWNSGTPVLCMAGSNALDAAAAALLAQVLRKRGIAARALPWKERGTKPIDAEELRGVRLVCLSFLDPSAVNAARFLVRRMRRRAGEVKVLVALWGRADATNGQSPKNIGADYVVGSLKQTLAAVLESAVTPAARETERAAE